MCWVFRGEYIWPYNCLELACSLDFSTHLVLVRLCLFSWNLRTRTSTASVLSLFLHTIEVFNIFHVKFLGIKILILSLKVIMRLILKHWATFTRCRTPPIGKLLCQQKDLCDLYSKCCEYVSTIPSFLCCYHLDIII
jgi:hypothetical protein